MKAYRNLIHEIFLLNPTINKWAIAEYSSIEDCINNIETQVEEIQDEIKSLEKDKDLAEQEYNTIMDEIYDITNSYVKIDKTRRSVSMEKYITIPEDKKDELSDSLDVMEGWKDEYWDKDSEISDQQILELAKDNLNTATDQLNELGRMMYD